MRTGYLLCIARKAREKRETNQTSKEKGGEYPATCLPRYSTIRVSTVVTSQRERERERENHSSYGNPEKKRKSAVPMVNSQKRKVKNEHVPKGEEQKDEKKQMSMARLCSGNRTNIEEDPIQSRPSRISHLNGPT